MRLHRNLLAYRYVCSTIDYRYSMAVTIHTAGCIIQNKYEVAHVELVRKMCRCKGSFFLTLVWSKASLGL